MCYEISKEGAPRHEHYGTVCSCPMLVSLKSTADFPKINFAAHPRMCVDANIGVLKCMFCLRRPRRVVWHHVFLCKPTGARMMGIMIMLLLLQVEKREKAIVVRCEQTRIVGGHQQIVV